jgi:putative molybdopterin biosynthesis protein
MVTECGGTPTLLPAVPDNPALLREALRNALQDHHLVALIAGSSAGAHDFTADVIAGEGELLAHGIEVMPGKPAVLGVITGKPVMGIPGYPVSAIVIAREILQPALWQMLGEGSPTPQTTLAVAPRKIPSPIGLEEFVRVTLGRVNGKLMAVPLARGAGIISTMVRADGLLRIPRMVEGINAGEEVNVELLRSPQEVDRTILCTGSHDLSIGVLEDQLKRRDTQLRIATSNIGSLGGLHSIRRGETHIAGTHLLDPATGVYNVPDIERVLPGSPVVLVHCVKRQQGLLVPRGNPQEVSGIADLGRRDLRFINRQPGSGTRVLLDFKLTQLGIETSSIHGYHHEEFTHMAIAVAVASGLADTGLGILSAADALGLDFIPVGDEQYDLLMLRSFYESSSGGVLLSALRSGDFKRAVQRLGGYDTGATGEILYEFRE